MIEVLLIIIIILLLSVLGILLYIYKLNKNIYQNHPLNIDNNYFQKYEKDIFNKFLMLQDTIAKIDSKIEIKQTERLNNTLSKLEVIFSQLNDLLKNFSLDKEAKNIVAEKNFNQFKENSETDSIYDIVTIYNKLKQNEKIHGIKIISVAKRKIDYNNLNEALSSSVLIESNIPAGLAIEYNSELYLFPTFESIYLHDDIKSFFEILNKEGRIVKIIKPSVLIKKSNGFYLHTKGKIL